MFALVDCNNFYASCERVFNPKLQDRPIIVLSNNDGCAVARSNEAKALGIKMGAPLHQIKDLVKAHNIAVFSSNYQLYGDMSGRVMDTLRDFCPSMEVYSIDEAFLDLSGFHGVDLAAYAADIRARVRQHTGIPVCIGIAPSKTLAKIANQVAKKKTVTGVFDLSVLDVQESILRDLEVTEIWGIARNLGQRLNALGIYTAWQLRSADAKMIRQSFGVVGERIVRELRGISCIGMEEVQPKQNIMSSRSFGQLVTRFDILENAVASHAANGGMKMRKQNSRAQAVYVFISTNRFRLQDEQYSNAATVALPVASSDTGQLIAAAKLGLRQIYRKGFNYKKAGVMMLDLVQAGNEQQSLFAPATSAAGDKVMEAMDALNRRYGKGTVFSAGQGIAKPWDMKATMRSPRYTTQWEELPVLNNWF